MITEGLTKAEILAEQHAELMSRLSSLVRRAEDVLNDTPDWVIESMRKNVRQNNQYSRFDDYIKPPSTLKNNNF